MALWENVKNFMGFESDDYEEDEVAQKNEEPAAAVAPVQHKEPRIVNSDRKAKNATLSSSQMQVVIVKPDHFEDVTMIADHINAKRSVVLNLEASNRETSRRIIDFISGVAYANHGTIRKVANSTFMITPNEVDISGELLMEDYEY